MVGRDRPGDGYAHGGTLSAGRHLNEARSGYPFPAAVAATAVVAMDAFTPRPATNSRSRAAGQSRQWKESPQAQDPVAFGLSIVKPCFSMVSTKSIVAPPR